MLDSFSPVHGTGAWHRCVAPVRPIPPAAAPVAPPLGGEVIPGNGFRKRCWILFHRCMAPVLACGTVAPVLVAPVLGFPQFFRRAVRKTMLPRSRPTSFWRIGSPPKTWFRVLLAMKRRIRELPRLRGTLVLSAKIPGLAFDPPQWR